VRSFRSLTVWKKSHELALRVYDKTKQFPKSEIYGVTSQIRRAATSVPANIAEGCGRDTSADFCRFLHIAVGSASELEYFLLFSLDAGLLEHSDYAPLDKETTEVKRMLAALIQRIK